MVLEGHGVPAPEGSLVWARGLLQAPLLTDVCLREPWRGFASPRFLSLKPLTVTSEVSTGCLCFIGRPQTGPPR